MPWSVASSVSVAFWQTDARGVSSTTVTVAVQVEELPLTSVTVSKTPFAPTSAQTNAVWSSDRVAIPQASFEPLSI